MLKKTDSTLLMYHEIACDLTIHADGKKFFDVEHGLSKDPSEMDSSSSERLIEQLWRYIYFKYYVKDRASAQALFKGGADVRSIPNREDACLMRPLMEKCGSYKTTDSGWILLDERNKHLNDDVEVQKDSVTISAPSSSILHGNDNEVTLVVPAVRRYLLPGWTVIFGSSGQIDDPQKVKRHYMPAKTTDSLVAGVSAVVNYLNNCSVPFQLKSVNNVEGLARSDNMILYLEDSLPESFLQSLYNTLVSTTGVSQRIDPPPMTLRQQRGWGVAPEPTMPEGRIVSYGQSRCMLLAQSLILAGSSAQYPKKIECIKRTFRRAGLQYDKPYLREDRSIL